MATTSCFQRQRANRSCATLPAIPRATFAVYNPTNDMSYVEVRGTIVVTDDPMANTRDRIVQKHGYADGSAFDAPGTQRFTLRLTPTKITGR